jgi:O-antigen ligase
MSGNGVGAPPIPPSWHAWAATAAAFLLPFHRLDAFGASLADLHLTPGEWLLLPLAILSASMGLLRGMTKPGRGLPDWLFAILPALFWILAMLPGMARNGFGAHGSDLALAWIVRLVLPAPVFLPLLADRERRDRLFMALSAGVLANVLMATRQLITARPDGGAAAAGVYGFLDSPNAYGLLLALFLPLLADWRGGERGTGVAVFTLLCTFLVPAMALMSVLSGGLLFAAFAGLLVVWTMWRSYAWIVGVFVCLLVFGYGAESRRRRDRERRETLTAAVLPTLAYGGPAFYASEYERALDAFVARPFFGEGVGTRHTADTDRPVNLSGDGNAPPWYAALLRGSGLAGIGLWLALLAELLARAAGRGGTCAFAPGILGGVAALAAAGLWANALPPGAGAFVGLLLAFSVVREAGGASPPPARRRVAPPRRRGAGSEKPTPGADSPGGEPVP